LPVTVVAQTQHSALSRLLVFCILTF